VVPREVDGVQTDVMEVGDLRIQQGHTDRWRPAPGGVSIGHYKITAGTLSCVVRDRTSGARLILSNNHVLANSNDAAPGDAILQPGAADGGREEDDLIAHLERFTTIQFNTQPATCDLAKGYAGLGNFVAGLLGSSHQVQVIRANPQAANLVDCAVARPVDEGMVLDEILEIGTPSGVIAASLGMAVRKSGRTTGLTSGVVTVLDATVTVSYGYDQNGTFEEQIVSGPMSQGGDSGSLLLAGDSTLAVGLLFAGSDQATIFNPIQAVLDSLQVSFGSTTISKAVDEGLNGERQTTIEKIQAVKENYQDFLLSKPNVVGVGAGLRHREGKRTDQLALVVMVDKKVPKVLLNEQDMIPAEIDGVPIDVKEVGQLKAQ
jgi:hypothetical protein